MRSSNLQIDVVVPVAPKDLCKLPLCLRGIARHSQTPIRRIYVLSPRELDLPDKVEGIPVCSVLEHSFPFTKAEVGAAVEGGYTNGSWYYQQLLKLYVFRAVPELLPEVLILDADFVWLEDLPFLTEDGRAWLAYGYPFKWLLGTLDYPPVDHVHADFAARVVANWAPQHRYSGMQHHMLFSADILEDLLCSMEARHAQPAWRAFMAQVTLDKWNAASEYVLYHHFALHRYPDRVALRHLRAYDVIHDADQAMVAEEYFASLLSRSDLHAAGCHAFLGLRDRLHTMDYLSPSLRAALLTASRPFFALRLDGGQLWVDEGLSSSDA